GRDAQRALVRALVAAVGEHGFRPSALDRDELRDGDAVREDDARRDADELRREGDALTVVAGRRGDHTRSARRRIELEDRVERAADLERARALQVLELEEHVASGELADRRGALRRRATDVRRDAARALACFSAYRARSFER